MDLAGIVAQRGLVGAGVVGVVVCAAAGEPARTMNNANTNPTYVMRFIASIL